MFAVGDVDDGSGRQVDLRFDQPRIFAAEIVEKPEAVAGRVAVTVGGDLLGIGAFPAFPPQETAPDQPALHRLPVDEQRDRARNRPAAARRFDGGAPAGIVLLAPRVVADNHAELAGQLVETVAQKGGIDPGFPCRSAAANRVSGFELRPEPGIAPDSGGKVDAAVVDVEEEQMRSGFDAEPDFAVCFFRRIIAELSAHKFAAVPICDEIGIGRNAKHGLRRLRQVDTTPELRKLMGQNFARRPDPDRFFNAHCNIPESFKMMGSASRTTGSGTKFSI